MSRYNVEFKGETDSALESLAQHASSKADALRKAISIAKWVADVQRSGGQILVRKGDGSLTEVHWS
jgi:hypothetical protein